MYHLVFPKHSPEPGNSLHNQARCFCSRKLPPKIHRLPIDQSPVQAKDAHPDPPHSQFPKTYADMIQGIVMIDDALIVEGTSRKYYSCKPRIEIIIKYMDGYDCDYNKKKIERQV